MRNFGWIARWKLSPVGRGFRSVSLITGPLRLSFSRFIRNTCCHMVGCRSVPTVTKQIWKAAANSTLASHSISLTSSRSLMASIAEVLFIIITFRFKFYFGAIRPSDSKSGKTPPAVIVFNRTFGIPRACSTLFVRKFLTVKSLKETDA